MQIQLKLHFSGIENFSYIRNIQETKDSLCKFEKLEILTSSHFRSIRPTSKNCLFPVRRYLKFFIPRQPEKFFFTKLRQLLEVCVDRNYICYALLIFYGDHLLHCLKGNSHQKVVLNIGVLKI